MTARISLIAGTFLISVFPLAASASTENFADSENARCVKVCTEAAAKKKPCPKPTYIVCKSERVKGHCEIKGCVGESYTGLEGKSQGAGNAGGFQEILKSALGILQQLMQQKKGGGAGNGGGSQQYPPDTKTGCAQYYQVTAPSSDPCAYYVPPTSATLLGTSGDINSSASDALTEALSGGTLNVSESLLGTLSNVSSESETQSQQGTTASTNTDTTPVTESTSQGQVNLQSGTRGDIVVSDGGATIYAQARDAQANTEVAGFYGSSGTSGQPQGIISGLCQSRPWQSAIVSFVIPPAFFDSLCAWRGYQVGRPAPASAPVVQKPVEKPASAPAATTSVSTGTAVTVPPQVDIWAVPEKVPLGTRTSVFWNTKGVQNCSITSPDGSFNEDSLSGGAATVPLSGPTTFTISCLTPTGTPVTDYVTVQLAI